MQNRAKQPKALYIKTIPRRLGEKSVNVCRVIYKDKHMLLETKQYQKKGTLTPEELINQLYWAKKFGEQYGLL